MLALLCVASVHALLGNSIVNNMSRSSITFNFAEDTYMCVFDNYLLIDKMFFSSCKRGSSEVASRPAGRDGQPSSLGRRPAGLGQVHLPSWLPLGPLRLLGGRVRVAGVHLDSARWGGVEVGGRAGGGRDRGRGGGRRVMGRLPGSVRDKDFHQLGAGGSLHYDLCHVNRHFGSL